MTHARQSALLLGFVFAVGCDGAGPTEGEGLSNAGKADQADDVAEHAAAPFADCHDFGNGGAAPPNAFSDYRIRTDVDDYPVLQPISADELSAADPAQVLHHIVEDFRFTTYKCWDAEGRLTGFDIEMIAQVGAEAGYEYIHFVERPWTTVTHNGNDTLSLLVDLIEGLGDSLSAGMSITEEREALVDMIGPIYKAGKSLMARPDNPEVAAKLDELSRVPEQGYEALRGLSAIDEASTIRGDFYRQLAEQHPEFVRVTELGLGDDLSATPQDPDFFEVYLVNSIEIINELIDGRMQNPVQGRHFDLVMIDTGSAKSLLEEGKLGDGTEVVSGNLAADRTLGEVFGTGDGISLAKGESGTKSELYRTFEPIVAEMMVSGRVNELVEKWFADDNAADPSWAHQLLGSR